MADDATAAALPTTLDPATLQRVLTQLMADPPPVASRATPSTREGRGFLSLLGEGLGGGQLVGSTAEREQGGLSALGAMGARMLQASDYSYQPHTFGSIFGQGLGAASENLGRSQAISSARLSAAQEEAHQQQQDKIARLKEALPFLTLAQNQAAVRGMPGTLLGGAPGTGGSIGGDGTYVGAIGGHEGTGQNPNSSAGGVGQFIDSTWADFVKENPSYFAGMTPEQAMAARKNPDFGAKVGPVAIEWLAKKNADALTGAGITPSGQSLGIAHYLGAGTAAKVMAAPDNTPVSQFVGEAALAANPELRRMTVGQMKQRYAGTPAPTFLRGAAPAPGQVAPATPPGQNPIGRAPLPAPEPSTAGQSAAAEAGTVQVAGKTGAPTGTTIPPSPPGSPGTVAAITQGMVAAGADPATLAPGPGSKPGLAPGANVTAQLSPLPPGMDPNSREAYGILHPIVPPPDMLKLFNGGLTPEQQRDHDTSLRALEVAYQTARDRKDPVAAAAVQEKLVALGTATGTLRENARRLGVETQRGYYKDREAALDAAHAAEQKQRDEVAAASRQHDRALEIKQEEGRQSRLSTEAGSVVESNKLIRDSLAKDSVAAASRVQSLGGLRALSDNVADNNTTLQGLANVRYGGTTLLNHLASVGIVPKENAGPIQMLQSGISGTIAELRSGMPMGSLSDRDLSFIESMGPSLYENQATRSAVISYLQQAARAKMRFNTVYNEEMTRPGATSATALEKARDIMETKHPVVPRMPQEIYDNIRNMDPAWQKKVIDWQTENNISRHTFYRKPNGSLELVH